MRRQPQRRVVLRLKNAKLRAQNAAAIPDTVNDDDTISNNIDISQPVAGVKRRKARGKIKQLQASTPFDYRKACWDLVPAAIEHLGAAIAKGSVTRESIRAAEIILSYAVGKPDTNVNMMSVTARVDPASALAEVERRRKAQGRTPLILDVDTVDAVSGNCIDNSNKKE